MEHYVLTRPLPDPGSPLDSFLARRLMALGFDARWPVYCHADQYVSISLSHIRAALFESSRSERKLVELEAEFPQEGDVEQLPMLLDLVQAVLVPPNPRRANGHKRISEYPDFYLRGTLRRVTGDPRPRTTPMHAYVRAASFEQITEIYLQVVPRLSASEPDAELCWAKVAPSELIY